MMGNGFRRLQSQSPLQWRKAGPFGIDTACLHCVLECRSAQGKARVVQPTLRLASKAMILLGLSLVSGADVSCAETPQPAASLHQTTEWQISPSFKFDVLCSLNILSGDPFYLDYYKDDYAQLSSGFTAEARAALTDLKLQVKGKNRKIISAFLTLYFSATDDETLEDMLRTLKDSTRMQENLKQTPYYSDAEWHLYASVRGDLRTIFNYLKNTGFDLYWKENILPREQHKIEEIERDLPKYNIIPDIEKLLGHALPSNRIIVYMLYYSQPHGIKITGTRFLTDQAWPFQIVLRNAVHEMMHPPFDLARDRELRQTLAMLKTDPFLIDKVRNHNPDWGYNSFDGFIEEDCVQALEQIINEKLHVQGEARKRWKETDEGMHVFAVALYSVMQEENFYDRREPFRNFLIRTIRSGRLGPGNLRVIYDKFYSGTTGR